MSWKQKKTNESMETTTRYMGAVAIIVPTYDAVSWGEHQHLLHSRVGEARAVEYALPVVRANSSGISQIILPNGHVTATAGFPGPGQIMVGRLPIESVGHIPWDRIAAQACVVFVICVIIALIVTALTRRFSKRPLHAPGP